MFNGLAGYRSLNAEIGYYGEKINPEQMETYEKERQKRSQERLDKAVEDISTAARIPDPEVRKALLKALWRGITRPEVDSQEILKVIDEASIKLEAWIFEPVDKKSQSASYRQMSTQ
jgi:hypothetical protein